MRRASSTSEKRAKPSSQQKCNARTLVKNLLRGPMVDLSYNWEGGEIRAKKIIGMEKNKQNRV